MCPLSLNKKAWALVLHWCEIYLERATFSFSDIKFVYILNPADVHILSVQSFYTVQRKSEKMVKECSMLHDGI